MMLESLLRLVEKSGQSQTKVKCLHGLHGPQKDERIYSQRQKKRSQSDGGNNVLPSFNAIAFCVKKHMIAKVRKADADLSWSHRSGPDQNIIVHNSSHIWRTRKLNGKIKDHKNTRNL